LTKERAVDMLDLTSLAGSVAAGLDGVRTCVFLSRDGFTLGAYPSPEGEAEARLAWGRLTLAGNPERGFLVVDDEVWVIVRRDGYTGVVVASPSVRAGLILDRLDAALGAIGRGEVPEGSGTSTASEGAKTLRWAPKDEGAPEEGFEAGVSSAPGPAPEPEPELDAFERAGASPASPARAGPEPGLVGGSEPDLPIEVTQDMASSVGSRVEAIAEPPTNDPTASLGAIEGSPAVNLDAGAPVEPSPGNGVASSSGVVEVTEGARSGEQAAGPPTSGLGPPGDQRPAPTRGKRAPDGEVDLVALARELDRLIEDLAQSDEQ